MNELIMPQSIVADIRRLFNNYAGSDYKYMTLYFQPNSSYADSWVRAERKGGGFLGLGAPGAGAQPERFQIAITFRPGAFLETWAGYSIDVRNDGSGRISLFRYWPENPSEYRDAIDGYEDEDGGSAEFDADPALLPRLIPHLEALLQCPVSTTEPPREAPDTMF